tara:strand:+ start:1857 stop:3362 length:1506 start_codon:yes stop_codon:yes gene_type:complete
VDTYGHLQIRKEFQKRGLACPRVALSEMKKNLQQMFNIEQILHDYKQQLNINNEIMEHARSKHTTIPFLKKYIAYPQFKQHLTKVSRKGRSKNDYITQLLSLCALHQKEVKAKQLMSRATVRQELTSTFGKLTEHGKAQKIEKKAKPREKRSRSTIDLQSTNKMVYEYINSHCVTDYLSLTDPILIQALMNHFSISSPNDCKTEQDRAILIYTHLLNKGQEGAQTRKSIRPPPLILQVKAFEITKIVNAAKTMGLYSVMKYYNDHKDVLSSIENTTLMCSACHNLKKKSAFTATQIKKGKNCKCDDCVADNEPDPSLIVDGFPANIINQIVRGNHPNTPSLYERFQSLAPTDFLEASNNMLPEVSVYPSLQYAIADYANRTFSVDLCTMQYRTCGCCNAFDISSGLMNGLKSSAYNHLVKRKKFVYYNETTRQYMYAHANHGSVKTCTKVHNPCNNCVKHLTQKKQPKFDCRNCFHAGVPVPSWVEDMSWSEIACCKCLIE